jgi:hypothetical protein
MVAIKGGTWAMTKPWSNDIEQASMHLQDALNKAKTHAEILGLSLSDVYIDVPVYTPATIGNIDQDFHIGRIVFEPQIIL